MPSPFPPPVAPSFKPLTVRQMIEALSKLDQDAPVCIRAERGEQVPACAPEEITCVNTPYGFYPYDPEDEKEAVSVVVI